MTYTIEDIVAHGWLESTDKAYLAPEDITERIVDIHPTAWFHGAIAIGEDITIGERAGIGDRCRLHDGATIGRLARLGDEVELEEKVSVGERTVVLRAAYMGRSAVLGAGVIVGPEVDIPAWVQIGSHMIIPTSHSLVTLGPLGDSNRVMTIHGSANGPRFSAGCQNSVPWEVIERRILTGTETSETSAEHYREYLGVIEGMGQIVQEHWHAQAVDGVIDRLVQQAAALARSTPE